MHKSLLRTVAAALAIAGCAIAADAAGNLVLRGLVTDAESWASNAPQRGIYYIPMSAGEEFRPVAVSNENWIAPYAGYEMDGIYYSHDVIDKGDGTKEYFINKYNLYTDENIGRIASGGYTPILHSNCNGSVYAVLLDEFTGNLGLGYVFYSTSDVSYRSQYSITDEYSALYADGRDFYLIQNVVENGTVTGSNWGRYDTRRRLFTVIGATGVAPRTTGSITRHPQTGELYWSVNGSLYKLDMSTGQATEIVAWPGKQHVVSLEFVEEINLKAPYPAENLHAVFENGSLSGRITFTSPASNLNGQQGDHLDYTVTDASTGTVLATGTCGYNEEVEASVTVPANGWYDFEVTVASGTNTAEPASLRAYVGKDAPASPRLQPLEIADNAVTLRWEPVTSSLNGGYVDPAAITYSVVRYPDAVKVAEKMSETSLSDILPEYDTFTTIYYGVTAHYETYSSPERASLKTTAGSIVPPYNNTFPSSDSMLGFTAISGNGSSSVWQSNFMGGVRVNGDTDKDMDQWLISPPIKLESGYNYLIKIKGYTNGNRKENLSIVYGDEPTMEAMTNVLTSTELSAYSVYYPDEAETFLAPTQSGVHHIALHATTPKGSGCLYVTELSIELGISDKAPGSSSDITVQRNLSGKPEATVSFKAPTQTYSGDPLTAITGITIRRGDTVVKEFGQTEPGSELSFFDELPAPGEYTYRIQAFNSEGGGFITSSEKSFVGAGKPTYPTSVKAVETADGIVNITWDPITSDVDGNTIDPAYVSYEIHDDDRYLATNHSATSLTYDYGDAAAKQRFRNFGVRGVTAGGTGSYSYSLIAVGRPLDEFNESFPGGNYSTYPDPSFVQLNLSAGARWNLGNESLGLFPAQDGDNGFVAMVAESAGATSGLMTLKINLSGMTNPGVSLWVRGFDDGKNKNLNEIYIDAREAGTDTWTELTGKVIGDIAVNGKWTRIGADLDAFAGKTVQILIRGVANNYQFIGVDNVSVTSMTGNDLEVKGISAQASVMPGEEFNIGVNVRNNGIHTGAPYKVELYADGDQAASLDCEALEPLQETVVTFSSAITDKAVEYHAVIVSSGDENTDNNTSARITVQPIVNRLPRVNDLSASAAADNTVVLSWSEPDLTGATVNEHVAESFETAQSFTSSVDGWTFVDVDDKPVGAISSLQLPNYSEGARFSFFVMDASDDYPDNKNVLPAASGHKCIVSMYAADNSAVDDWAISPELSGHAQTVTFSARSVNASYPEMIDVMYSTEGTEIAGFKSLPAMTDILVPGSWIRYSVGIPEGAIRFAIRSHAANSFMLAVDDIEFESADNRALEAPIGYNVFRDDLQLTETDVTGTSFTDSDVEEGTHTYHVTAVYDAGESGISNKASIFTSGINENEIREIRIESADGLITVSGAADTRVMVCGIDGRIIFNAVAESDCVTIPAATGVYVVTACGQSAKIAVK